MQPHETLGRKTPDQKTRLFSGPEETLLPQTPKGNSQKWFSWLSGRVTEGYCQHCSGTHESVSVHQKGTDCTYLPFHWRIKHLTHSDAYQGSFSP